MATLDLPRPVPRLSIKLHPGFWAAFKYTIATAGVAYHNAGAYTSKEQLKYEFWI